MRVRCDDPAFCEALEAQWVGFRGRQRQGPVKDLWYERPPGDPAASPRPVGVAFRSPVLANASVELLGVDLVSRNGAVPPGTTVEVEIIVSGAPVFGGRPAPFDLRERRLFTFYPRKKPAERFESAYWPKGN